MARSISVGCARFRCAEKIVVNWAGISRFLRCDIGEGWFEDCNTFFSLKKERRKEGKLVDMLLITAICLGASGKSHQLLPIMTNQKPTMLCIASRHHNFTVMGFMPLRLWDTDSSLKYLSMRSLIEILNQANSTNISTICLRKYNPEITLSHRIY